MLYYFKKDKNATKMQKQICTVYGKGAMSDRMCQKWFTKKFHAGEISHWMMLQGQVDQLKLIAIKLKHLLRTINVLPCGK